MTDEQGQFSFPALLFGSATVTFQRWGYQPATLSVALVAGSTVNLALAPKPVIILKDTQGLSHRADYELSQFGYVVLFGNLGQLLRMLQGRAGSQHQSHTQGRTAFHGRHRRQLLRR